MVADLALIPDEHIMNENHPDMDDLVACENEDGDAAAMIEESPSGIWILSQIIDFFKKKIYPFRKCEVTTISYAQ